MSDMVRQEMEDENAISDSDDEDSTKRESANLEDIESEAREGKEKVENSIRY